MCPDHAPSQASPFLTIRLDPETRAELKKLAKANDRTLGAEARVAIRAHLKQAA